MRGYEHILCITGLTIISISYCVCNIVINDYSTQDILFQICFTFLISILVFLVTVTLPRITRFKLVEKNIENILCEFKYLSELIDESVMGGKFIDDEGWLNKCGQSLSKNSNVPNPIPTYYFPIRFQCWYDYFEYLFFKENEYINKLLRYSQYLPIEVIAFIGSIEKEDGLRDIIYFIDKQYEWDMIPQKELNVLCEKFLEHKKLLCNCVNLI